MPQIFQVLRCYKCLVFQVHQTKKLNKWQCKLCGEKQSITRHYGLGNGKECRLRVQKLNLLKGQNDEKVYVVNSDDDDDDFEDYDEKNVHEQIVNKSKWLKYVEEKEDIEDVNKSTYTENDAVSLEIPRKRKKFNFLTKELTQKNLKSKAIEITANDTVKNKNFSALERASEIPVNNTSINCITLDENNHKLFSNKAKNNQALVQKPSKWDMFIDIEDDLEIVDESQVVENFGKVPRKMFECCDDSELDLILSI